jgi:hypothetical protein
MKTKKQIKRKTKKQKGGRLRCSTTSKGKWVAMTHNDTTVRAYRECEARFMNMLYPSISCTPGNLRDLYRILTDTTAISGAFNKLDYYGQNRVLVNLRESIRLRNTRDTDATHLAFLVVEQDLLTVLEPLLKDKPPDTEDHIWDDVKTIESDIDELRQYRSELQKSERPEGVTQSDIDRELDDIREKIESLEKEKLKFDQSYVIPAISDPKSALSQPAAEKAQAGDEGSGEGSGSGKRPGKGSGAADAEAERDLQEKTRMENDALDKAIQQAERESLLFADHDRHTRRIPELQSPPVQSMAENQVRFLPDLIETELIPFFKHAKISKEMSRFQILRAKTTLEEGDFNEYRKLQNTIFTFILETMCYGLFTNKKYTEKEFGLFLKPLFFMSKTTPPYSITTLYKSSKFIENVPNLYKCIYLLISHFSKHELLLTRNIRICAFYIDDYLYLFNLFLTLFDEIPNLLLTKMKRLVRQCIDNINENKPTQVNKIVPLFSLPVYIISDSLSIDRPFFHETMNAKLIENKLIINKLITELTEVIQRKKREEFVDIGKKAKDLNQKIIPEYLNLFITNINPILESIFRVSIATKDNTIYLEKMSTIVNVFLSIYKDLTTTTLYQLKPEEIIDLKEFVKYISIFANNLKTNIDKSLLPPENYHTYVKLYHFIYLVTDDKTFETKHVDTFNKAIDYIFEHNL